MASLFNHALSNVAAVAVASGGATSNVDAIQSGAAECGLATSPIAYRAYTVGTSRVPTPHTKLRGVAVLFPEALHVVSVPSSRIYRLRDLSGHHIGLGTPAEPVPARRGAAAKAIIDAADELSGAVRETTTTELGLDDAVSQLENGRIGVVFLSGGYPFRPVTQLANHLDVTFLNFDETSTSLLKSKYPFFKPLMIPAGTYRGQTTDLHTIAVDNLLVCSADLSTDIVYRITRALQEGLSTIAAAHESGKQINSEDGPSTPIPLHDGAKRFYRERELVR